MVVVVVVFEVGLVSGCVSSDVGAFVVVVVEVRRSELVEVVVVVVVAVVE